MRSIIIKLQNKERTFQKTFSFLTSTFMPANAKLAPKLLLHRTYVKVKLWKTMVNESIINDFTCQSLQLIRSGPCQLGKI